MYGHIIARLFLNGNPSLPGLALCAQKNLQSVPLMA